ncbi:hypothetical protein Tco_0016651 [Tanacetum coccineum]
MSLRLHPPFTPARSDLYVEEPLVFGPAPRPAGDVDPVVIELIIFGPPPRPHGYVDPDFVEPIIFGPQPRPENYREPEDLDNPMDDDTTHGGFHVESPVRPDDAPTPTADAAGRAEDPTLLTSLSEKLDRCMGRIDSLETELGTTKKIMGGAILTLVSRVKKLEKTVKQLRTTRLVGDAPAAEGDVDIQADVDIVGLSRMASAALGHDQPAVPSEDVEEREEAEVPLRRKRSAYRRARTEFATPAFEQFQSNLSAGGLPHTAVSESAGPSVAADKGKAPMPDLDIPAEFLAEDAQARKRFEEEQASARLVQQLQAEDLAQADVPIVSEQRAKELDELMLRMTETDWLTLMMQVGTNPALARELLGADVTEDNFIERMTAIKERKKRALADLRYRALKGKPLKQSEVTQMMRNLVKNQWCAAHNGTITMTAVKAMTKQQLLEEYEYICKRLEKDRLLSAQHNLFRPKPAISEPPSKRQRVDRGTSPPSGVPAATTQPADDPNSDAMDSAGSHHESGVSPFADSADSSSPSNVTTDPIPIDVLFASTSGGINDFFLDSDEEEQIGRSRVAADPDSNDEVLVEILFRGKYISGAGVVGVDMLPDDEIVDPRVKVETIPASAASPPRSESESDDDMDNYIPPILYGAFKDWEIVRCPLTGSGYHKSSVMSWTYERENEYNVCGQGYYPIRATLLERMLRHKLTVPPSYCRDVVIAGNIIQTVQDGLRQAYECLASAPMFIKSTSVAAKTGSAVLDDAFHLILLLSSSAVFLILLFGCVASFLLLVFIGCWLHCIVGVYDAVGSSDLPVFFKYLLNTLFLLLLNPLDSRRSI